MSSQKRVDANERQLRRENLIKECEDGITEMDKLPNTEFELSGEAEAMYFMRARVFMCTSLAHRVLSISNDVYGGM